MGLHSSGIPFLLQRGTASPRATLTAWISSNRGLTPWFAAGYASMNATSSRLKLGSKKKVLLKDKAVRVQYKNLPLILLRNGPLMPVLHPIDAAHVPSIPFCRPILQSVAGGLIHCLPLKHGAFPCSFTSFNFGITASGIIGIFDTGFVLFNDATTMEAVISKINGEK